MDKHTTFEIAAKNGEERGFKKGYKQGYEDGKREALRAQREAEKNEPLTLEELQKTSGRWAWIVTNCDEEVIYGWALVGGDRAWAVRFANTFRGYAVLTFLFDNYGGSEFPQWLAYRRPPVGEG